MVTAEEEENPELSHMTSRFWVGPVLTVPVFVMAVGEMIPGGPLQLFLAPAVQPWAELVLATPVVLWAGWPLFVRLWATFINRSANILTLIGIGTGAAYGFSVAATIFPFWFPPSFRGHPRRSDR